MSPETPHQSTATHDFRMMIQIDMEIKSFQSDWMHCDYISTYVARAISHNRPDSVLFANLFSAALNELLELTFRTSGTNGSFACKIMRHGTIERIELTFTCGEEERRLFEESIARLQSGRARGDYIDLLSAGTAQNRDALLIELAASYNATLGVTANADGTTTLGVELPLGGMAH